MLQRLIASSVNRDVLAELLASQGWLRMLFLIYLSITATTAHVCCLSSSRTCHSSADVILRLLIIIIKNNNSDLIYNLFLILQVKMSGGQGHATHAVALHALKQQQQPLQQQAHHQQQHPQLQQQDQRVEGEVDLDGEYGGDFTFRIVVLLTT
jgi:hypothetical protein